MRLPHLRLPFAATAACLAVAAPGLAQTAPPDLLPSAESDEPVSPPVCTDRPTKANVTCTVPLGDVQIESDGINWTRSIAGGVRSDTILYTNPTLKYGLGSRTDVEVNVAPYETVATGGSVTAAGGVATAGGVGDLYLRVKQRLSADTAMTQVAVIPFVKAPVARSGIGNGRWEGGVAVPVGVPVKGGFTLTLGPEIDVLADGIGPGYHAALTSLVNLSHGVGTKITLYAECWNSQNLDPAGTVHQYSADFAVAYSVTPTLQLDLGGNFGLNRSTPASQVYFGVSTRF